MPTLEVVRFENGKYGLQNTFTKHVVDREFRTIWGASRYRSRNAKRLKKAIRRLNKQAELVQNS